jgi:ATP:cob(I)alamin adenosyltransferase
MVIPGKSILEAQIHITRTVARRAERVFTALNERQPLCPKAGVFLNRLSDYLFVLSQQE